MTEKEEQILNAITNYFKDYKTMPSIRYLQKKLNYKSHNSIYQYLNKLVKKNYLTKAFNGKFILNENLLLDSNIKKIKIINSKDKYLNIILDKKKDYTGFILKNNKLKNDGFYKGDIFIIEKTQKIANNEIGLFIIDNQKRLMKYKYIDGFHILEDSERIILERIHLIGKAILMERPIKKIIDDQYHQ